MCPVNPHKTGQCGDGTGDGTGKQLCAQPGGEVASTQSWGRPFLAGLCSPLCAEEMSEAGPPALSAFHTRASNLFIPHTSCSMVNCPALGSRLFFPPPATQNFSVLIRTLLRVPITGLQHELSMGFMGSRTRVPGAIPRINYTKFLVHGQFSVIE